MRLLPLALLTLTVPLLAGCVAPLADDASGPAPLTSLEVYEYRYLGDNTTFSGIPYGWMARITNVAQGPLAFRVLPLSNDTTFGPAGNTSWETLPGPMPDVLTPGESKVYLFSARFHEAVHETGFDVQVLADVPADDEADVTVAEEGRFVRRIEWRTESPTVVTANQHVRTATVGVWLNGTSFYTNIADLNADPRFPAGYDRSEFGGEALPVYVYDRDRTEQPPGSKDTCHFTTIIGYNALLKTQAELGTNVRWLKPEEAYTRAGAEQHDLYGDVLIFMNTIVEHDGAVAPADSAPNPQGTCFNVNNTSPIPIPPPPKP